MNKITDWAKKNNIKPQAVIELFAILQGDHFNVIKTPQNEKSEASVQSLVRMEASQKSAILWRNNKGCLFDKSGRLVRFGLANDNKEQSKKFKSSDLIGFQSRYITQDDVGSVVAQFMAREVKHSEWRYTGTAEEQAQMAFIKFVVSKGGDACFANGTGTII